MTKNESPKARALREHGNRIGRVRISKDDHPEGLNRGDVVLVRLNFQTPPQDGLCVAFTPDARLVVRFYRRERGKPVRLSRTPRGEGSELFAPSAVMIFGPVVGVEKGEGHADRL